MLGRWVHRAYVHRASFSTFAPVRLILGKWLGRSKIATHDAQNYPSASLCCIYLSIKYDSTVSESGWHGRLNED